MEYLKYCGGKQLPTQFMEAQLDYFGAHSYDKKCEGPGEVKKGEFVNRRGDASLTDTERGSSS